MLQQFGVGPRHALELRGDRDRLVHIAHRHVERPGGIVRDQARFEVELYTLIAQRPCKLRLGLGLFLLLPDRPGRDDRPELCELRLRIALAQPRLQHVWQHPGVVEHVLERQLRAGRRIEIVCLILPVRLVRPVAPLLLKQQTEAILVRAADGLRDLAGIERVAQRQLVQILRQIHRVVIELRAEMLKRIGQRGPVFAVRADARIVDIALHALVEHAVIAVRLIGERDAADVRRFRGFRCFRCRRLFRLVGRFGLRRFDRLRGHRRLSRFVRRIGGFRILTGGKRQHHRDHK